MTVVGPSPAVVRRRPQARVAWLAATPLLVAALWSGLWLLASNRASAGLDDWLHAEAAMGRQWTCPERRVEGYPFALKISCSQPTFHGEVAGRIASGTAEALLAGISIRQPRTVLADLQGPFYLRAADDAFDLVASWSSLRVTLGPLPDPAREGSLEATRLAVTLSAPSVGTLNLRADRLAGRAEPAAGSGAAPGDEAFTFSGSGVSLPTLDGFMGSDDPTAAEGRGVLVHADRLSAPTAARLDGWRRDGGRLDLAAFRVSKGAFVGQGSGSLALDAGHRIAGRLDTSLQGFGPIAEQFGIPIAGVKLGGLISGLFGGKKPADPQPARADTVRLALSFADGHLSVGPFQTSLRLAPFY